jgi:hypothetical protein
MKMPAAGRHEQRRHGFGCETLQPAFHIFRDSDKSKNAKSRYDTFSDTSKTLGLLFRERLVSHQRRELLPPTLKLVCGARAMLPQLDLRSDNGKAGRRNPGATSRARCPQSSCRESFVCLLPVLRFL